MPTAKLWLTRQPLTSPYGPRPLTPGVAHKGADFAFGLGTPVTVCGPGRVVESGYHYEYGNYVRVLHDGRTWDTGIGTSYHSLQARRVRVGARVTAGQTIGTAGQSALGATGPHLHLGLWLGGHHVDPLRHLRQGRERTVRYGASAPVLTQIGDTAMRAFIQVKGKPPVYAVGPGTIRHIKAKRTLTGTRALFGKVHQLDQASFDDTLTLLGIPLNKVPKPNGSHWSAT
ncbi:MAG: M23 family metallopeptidase [Mycetocola reblochoni]|uniref:Peptidase, M23/M37 family n=2 Tax=Mycetocola reblochoni TaxID=331618 RepID=A0A1R4IWR4_9MICO|nr:M23 family metallopeptidase [Mycetocola reblochoni]RLP70963.1 M23 family metallopeptidase [Mycetocola reblochoni]SJN24148.1 peptidase, M23/M37 family [Mycetocola reblochoni REB411]